MTQRLFRFALLVIALVARARLIAQPVTRPRGLEEKCQIVRKWFGVVPRLPYGLWLRCGGEDFFITEPMSLIGHVHIASPAEALAFVRFFSLPDAAKYVRPEGMVEILPADSTGDFNTVSPRVFRRFFHEARTAQLPSIANDASKSFSVQRVMLTPQGQAVEVTEYVGSDGYYEIESRKVVLRDASKAGLYYLEH